MAGSHKKHKTGTYQIIRSFTGDCPAVSNYLADKKTKSAWLAPKFLDAFFRSYSQVMLCNNTLSGVIMYIALLFAHPLGAFTSTITCSIGIFTAYLIRQPGSVLSNGLAGYNPLLVGMVTAVSQPNMLTGDTAVIAWLYVIIASIISVYLAVHLASLLGRAGAPGLTWSFNITQYLLLIVLWTYRVNIERHNSVTEINQSQISESNITHASMQDSIDDEILPIDWINVFYGSVAASGQVFAVYDLAFSTLIYIGIFVFSPIMAASSFLGAFFGPLFFLAISNASLDNLTLAYNGVMGYNPLLCAAALGGFFYRLNFQTATLSCIGILITCILQLALAPAYPDFLNVQTIPFCISTCVFLITDLGTNKAFKKPKVISYPEKHLRENCDDSDFEVETVSCSAADENRSEDDIRIPVSEEEHAERQ
ncbi:urea transporter 2-like [Ctenocephalides felis]|uniref:urea transporter 2-like n=1 Tax=Ctenocephalides felis TaxID=7515 RepID=UPI000E6E50F9|nr:urea transporter 2-like [Ctenocephalides felis]